MNTAGRPSRRRGATLEDDLRAAALAELAEHGPGALSFERIAARAGAGKASLYRRWPDPGALVVDAVSNAPALVVTRPTAHERAEPTGTPHRPLPAGTPVGRAELRARVLTLLTSLADGLDSPLGLALRAVMVHRADAPDLHDRLVALVVAPVREELRNTFLDAGVDASDIVVGAGAQLVVMRSFSAPADQIAVVDIVDDVVVPLVESWAGADRGAMDHNRNPGSDDAPAL